MPDAQTLDRIEIVYEVNTSFDIDLPSGPRTVTAPYLVNAGVYSGLPTPEMIAGLIASRGIYPYDFEDQPGEGGKLAEEIAAAVNAQGITAQNITGFTVALVKLDDELIAHGYRAEPEPEDGDPPVRAEAA